MEVIPVSINHEVSILSILHVCGGDPFSILMTVQTLSVFSTCVEVILTDQGVVDVPPGILHVCGGDPIFAGF